MSIQAIVPLKSDSDTEPYRFTIYYVIILSLLSIAIGYIKIRNLFSLGYTSDLFMFDNVIKYTISGRFGIEYTYGNQFGEQAYFILLLLIPLKLILSDNMVVFLVLLGVIFYFFSGVAVFYHSKNFLINREAFFIASSYLFLFGMTIEGLFESIYGFHPDMIAGFCLVIYTIIEIQRQKKIDTGGNIKLHNLILSIIYLLFVSIKQEMALVAVIFFSSLFLFSRNRHYLYIALLSFSVFIFGMIFIHASQTEFNRGNWVLIERLINALRKDNVEFIFQEKIIKFYTWLFVISIPFLLARTISHSRDYFSLSLYISGIIKSFFAFISNDFSLLTWHNFPCVEMISGATVLQLAAWGNSINIRTTFIKLFFTRSSSFSITV